MRLSKSYSIATTFMLCATPMSFAGIANVFWEQNESGWDLFALVSADTIIFNADLGDENINLPPDGLNTGLFSTNGSILHTSFLTLGYEDVEVIVFTISPSGTGSLVDASWYTDLGAGPEYDPKTGYRIWLGRFFTDDCADLGGPNGGNDATTQSRIYLGWTDDQTPLGINVYDIPRSNDGIPDKCQCLMDLDADGNVGTSDLLALFAQWGTAGPADFDGNGVVNTADLLILFANWGPCP